MEMTHHRALDGNQPAASLGAALLSSDLQSQEKVNQLLLSIMNSYVRKCQQEGGEPEDTLLITRRRKRKNTPARSPANNGTGREPSSKEQKIPVAKKQRLRRKHASPYSDLASNGSSLPSTALMAKRQETVVSSVSTSEEAARQQSELRRRPASLECGSTTHTKKVRKARGSRVFVSAPSRTLLRPEGVVPATMVRRTRYVEPTPAPYIPSPHPEIGKTAVSPGYDCAPLLPSLPTDGALWPTSGDWSCPWLADGSTVTDSTFTADRQLPSPPPTGWTHSFSDLCPSTPFDVVHLPPSTASLLAVGQNHSEPLMQADLPYYTSSSLYSGDEWAQQVLFFTPWP